MIQMTKYFDGHQKGVKCYASQVLKFVIERCCAYYSSSFNGLSVPMKFCLIKFCHYHVSKCACNFLSKIRSTCTFDEVSRNLLGILSSQGQVCSILMCQQVCVASPINVISTCDFDNSPKNVIWPTIQMANLPPSIFQFFNMSSP